MQTIKFCGLLLCVILLGGGRADTMARQASEDRGGDLADSIQFLKQFRIGMTYEEVQQSLPRNLQQDALAYSTSDNVFMLGVGKSSGDDWSAYLVFDTSDLEIKKPERLVEIDCSSTLLVHDETFDSVVSRVSGSFGQPINMDRTARTSKAGWQTVGGSLLTLEYTPMTGAAPRTRCVVDFVIKSASRKPKETIA
jgi:hypothetical protein